MGLSTLSRLSRRQCLTVAWLGMLDAGTARQTPVREPIPSLDWSSRAREPTATSYLHAVKEKEISGRRPLRISVGPSATMCLAYQRAGREAYGKGAISTVSDAKSVVAH